MFALFLKLKPYAGAVVATLVLVLVQAMAELGLPTLMAGIIDQGVLGRDQGAVVSGGLWMLGLAFLGACR